MWRQVLSRAAVRGARGFADAKAPKAAAAAAAAAPAAPAAAAAAEVQLPLKQHGLPARYAGALFVASTKAKVLPTVEKELATVASLTQSNPDFASFLADPSQTKADKLKGINGIMEQGKFSATTKQFFAVLAENGRLADTVHIVDKFEELMMASRGEVKATVTSAEPLTPEELADAKAAIEGLVEKGQTLNLKTQVKPEIIAGLVVEIGDKYLDLSLDTRIRKMEQLLQQPL